MFSVASVIMLDGAARLERFVSRSLRVTACRRRHFAPRVNQTPIKCYPTGELFLRACRKGLNLVLQVLHLPRQARHKRAEFGDLFERMRFGFLRFEPRTRFDLRGFAEAGFRRRRGDSAWRRRQGRRRDEIGCGRLRSVNRPRLIDRRRGRRRDGKGHGLLARRPRLRFGGGRRKSGSLGCRMRWRGLSLLIRFTR